MNLNTDSDRAGVPAACTLSLDAAHRQSLEWAELRLHATAVAALATGVQMTLPASMEDDIEDLAARERSCCSFLSINTCVQADSLNLEVTTSDLTVLPLIHALAGVDSL